MSFVVKEGTMARQKVGLSIAVAGAQTWRSRPTPARKGQGKGKAPGAGLTRRDLLKRLVPVATFVAMAVPDAEDN